MKKSFILISVFIFFCTSYAKEPVDYVNPQIGSISHLLQPTFNTVHLPNSMLRFIPVKTPGISDHYVAGKIYGFPLNCPAHRHRAVMSLMPSSGSVDVRPDALASEYDHDFETATPYYYAVLLEDDEINAEFSPTARCGFYRFTFANSPSPANIILRGEKDVDIRIINATTIAAREVFKGVKQYAFLKFNRPSQSFGTFRENKINKQQKEVQGDNTGVYVTFDSAAEQAVEIKYGISYISSEQAQANLEREIPHWSFDEIRQNGRDLWNKALGQIKITGGSEDEKTVFYTALYRTFERMVNITEDGQYYSGYDNKVHQDERPFYVDDWSWDTYRAHHPLRAILNPGMEQDIIQSYVRMYEQSGWLPTFPQVYGDMKAMIGNHQDAIIADAWFKGLRNYDMGKAYEGMLKNAMHGAMLPWREGPTTELGQFYRQHGYFPALDPGAKDPVKEVNPFEKRQAVAVTLEHAYDDWCLARIAASLGQKKDSQKLAKRALNYKNVYNSKTGFMSPKKADGTWVEPFNPKNSGGTGCREYFAEINAWTYSFSVQHDVPGLMKLMGGRQQFIKRLDGLFAEPMYGYCRWTQTADIPDGTGMVGQFVMGNEQGFHVPYLYVYAGAPWKTQKRIRQLENTWFRNDLMGMCGDEDGGAMSSWYVFSAMGFYPITPGLPIYVIGTPLFDKVSIRLANGRDFVILAKNNSHKNKYIQSAALNGQPLEKAWFTHQDIINGGELVFQMGPRPNKKWGVDSLPPSFKAIF